MDHRHFHNHIPPPPTTATATAAADSWAFTWEPQVSLLHPQFPSESNGSRGTIRQLGLIDGSRSTAAAAEEELRRALLRATLELEFTRAAAQEELRRMEGQALRLARLLEAATQERDEARLQCHSLLLLVDQQNHHHLLPANPNPSPNNNGNNPSQDLATVDEGSNVVSSSSSEEEEGSNLSSSAAEVEAAAERRGLPEKGRLVEAVMGAGPLLQTLLVAGPLPQWRQPPPALQSFEIPAVSVPRINGQNWGREEVGFIGHSPSPSSSLPITPCYSPEINSSDSKYQTINTLHI